MLTSTRLSPFRELDLARPWMLPAPTAAVPMDAVRTDDALELRFDLPGYDPDSIDLSVERHVLTLTAERTRSDDDGSAVLVRERRHGAVRRQLRLSESLDTTRVEAHFDNGVLRVRVPVAETAQPHKVRIEVGVPPALEATATDATSTN